MSPVKTRGFENHGSGIKIHSMAEIANVIRNSTLRFIHDYVPFMLRNSGRNASPSFSNIKVITVMTWYLINPSLR